MSRIPGARRRASRAATTRSTPGLAPGAERIADDGGRPASRGGSRPAGRSGGGRPGPGGPLRGLPLGAPRAERARLRLLPLPPRRDRLRLRAVPAPAPPRLPRLRGTSRSGRPRELTFDARRESTSGPDAGADSQGNTTFKQSARTPSTVSTSPSSITSGGLILITFGS